MPEELKKQQQQEQPAAEQDESPDWVTFEANLRRVGFFPEDPQEYVRKLKAATERFKKQYPGSTIPAEVLSEIMEADNPRATPSPELRVENEGIESSEEGDVQ